MADQNRVTVATIGKVNLSNKVRIVWARRDTRWDVYPNQEPVQLAAHDWSGWWLPSPNGWFKAPTSYIAQCDATDTDTGAWETEQVTARVTIRHFVR